MEMKLGAIVIFCVAIIAALALWRCDRVKPEPPKPTTLETELVPPHSTIVIPVYYHVDSLEAIINNKVRGTFLKKWVLLNDKGDSLYLEMTRTGHVNIDWDKNAMACSFPLNVSGKFIKHLGALKIKNSDPVEMEVVVDLVTQVGIDKDWNLALESKLKHIRWVKDPMLKVGMVKVNLRNRVEEAIALHQEHLVDKMDDVLRTRLNTREAIAKIWIDLQKPIRINRKGVQVWLKPQAHDLQARLTQTGAFLMLEVALEATLQTVIEGDDPPPSNTTLPPFKLKTSTADSLKMFVRVTLPFETGNFLLEKELIGKTITAEGYSTTVKDVTAYGTAEGLALKIQVKGDVDGNIYLRGTPYYDTIKSVFAVKDFRFDVDTENALVKTADWMLHDNALGFVQDKLRIDVGPLIAQLPGLIENGIEKGRTGEKINLFVDRLEVVPQQMAITQKNIQIILKGTGKASIGLEKKVFAGKRHKKRV